MKEETKQTEFKVGQKVSDIRFGIGEIIEIDLKHKYPIMVSFEKTTDTYTIDGKALESDNYPILQKFDYTLLTNKMK